METGIINYAGLLCPKDRTALRQADNSLLCVQCNSLYPIRDGVLILLGNLSCNEMLQEDIYQKIAHVASDIRIGNDACFLTQPMLLNHVLRKQYMDLLTINNSEKILEIGTQFADHLVYVRNRFPAVQEENFFGIDISFENLKIAGRRMPAATFIKQAAKDLPFPDDYFDVVILCGILEHLENPEETIAELSRVMKDRGRLVVYVTVKDYEYSFQAFMVNIVRSRRYIAATEAIGHDYAIIKTLADYKGIFDKYGFNIVRGERIGRIVDTILDHLLLILYGTLGALRRLLTRQKIVSTVNSKNDLTLGAINQDVKRISKFKTLARGVLCSMIGLTYKLIGFERILFRDIGSSYSAYLILNKKK